jgi:lipopolysaccharide biosynthesis glycosyltransferase
MSTKLPQRLMTVSSPEFLLGTRVMLHSFLEQNSWFVGEIIVLHSRLRISDIALLEGQFAKLSCKRADAQLAKALDALVASFPHLEKRRDRFLSLDILLEDRAGPSLFLDSDMLIRGDLSSLTDNDATLVACRDATMLRGLRRVLATMEESEGQGSSFNAGVMLLQSSSPDLAEATLARLTPENWAAIRSDHTDQAVWNVLFADQVQLVDSRFNYLVGHSALQPLDEPEWPSLCALHYNGPAKPWLADRQMQAAAKGGLTNWAFAEWREAARAMLADAP